MARYDLSFKPSVARDLRGFRRPTSSARPSPFRGTEKLWAQARYRVRQGTYRILYSISDAELVVESVKVGHRRETYHEP